MTELLRLILAFLAVYRVSVLISRDYGPGFIFERLRRYVDTKAKVQQDDDKEYSFWQGFNEGINCPYCMGIWMAVLGTITIFYPTRIGDFILYVFGLAGGQSLLQRITE